ncbi:MAG TPA: SDR family NAD(P)-dependent oxidoreductase, partial [Xanthobacteraceae bacterium]|nr:SDR family NAD(P)-dependent oxidoreductase [Xanthobacteraceae bacterium]
SALGAVEVHLADLTDRKSIARLAADIKTTPIDVLICNAGIYGPRNQEFGATDYAAWEQVLRVNLLAPMAITEALIENVAQSQMKRIAMISSRMGSIALNEGGDPIYRSSKAALNIVAKGLAEDLRERGIITVALSPGWVRTDMGGSDAPGAPDEAVRGLRKVIASLTMVDTGKFFHTDGSELPW